MTDNQFRGCIASASDPRDSVCRAEARPSIRVRLRARLFSGQFDRALAVGVPAPVGSALAVHAMRLTSVSEREAVARALLRVARDAKVTRTMPSGRVALHRANVTSAEALIGAVTERLRAPHTINARGMARLRRLLADGTGPLYRQGRGDLAGRLGAALAAL